MGARRDRGFGYNARGRARPACASTMEPPPHPTRVLILHGPSARTRAETLAGALVAQGLLTVVEPMCSGARAQHALRTRASKCDALVAVGLGDLALPAIARLRALAGPAVGARIWLDGTDRTRVEPTDSARAREPHPALARILAQRAFDPCEVLDADSTPEAWSARIAARTAAADAPIGAVPTHAVDDDLLAAAVYLIEQERRLASWGRDLEEHRADLEAGGRVLPRLRAVRRRVRRFLRKRGLA